MELAIPAEGWKEGDEVGLQDLAFTSELRRRDGINLAWDGERLVLTIEPAHGQQNP
jgi:hypothetical protein